jgi:hypothetical protein
MKTLLALIPLNLMLAFFWAFNPTTHQNIPTTMKKVSYDDHAKEWVIVDSLENEGLVQSALDEVLKLYQIVKAEANSPQIVKCVIYRGKYESRLQEFGLAKAIVKMESEIAGAGFPEKQVLQSMVAELYGTYLDNNYWKLRNRKEEVNFKTDDIQTWTIGQLLEKSNELYHASAQESKTQSVDIQSIKAILNMGNDQLVRPTLYDFLAFRAISNFINERSYLPEPAYKFYLNDEQAFAKAEGFSSFTFSTRDTSSYKLKTLELFQSVIKSCISRKETSALVDADLQRLSFVYQNYVGDGKGKLYENALRHLLDKYSDSEMWSEVTSHLANYYLQRGESWQPVPFWRQAPGQKPVPEENKWDYKTAYDLCSEAIKKYPNSLGAGLCKSLQSQIQQKNIQIQGESVNLPSKPFLCKLEYRNLKQAHLKVVSLTPALRAKLDEVAWDERMSLINSFPVLSKWSLTLPDDGDYRQHAVEFSVEALPLGQYLIVASDNQEFADKKGGVNYFFTQVSNLAFISSRQSESKGLQFIVIDRENGNPLEGVLAEFFNPDYSRLSHRTELKKIGSALSDKNGMVDPNLDQNDNFQISLSQKKDKLLSDSWFYNYSMGRQSRELSTTFFTDRAIYRPGQTVYFKILLLSYDPSGMPEIVKNKAVNVKFRNTNHQEIASLQLRTNDFGTASGFFQTPTSGLLGQMYLESNANGSQAFRVEEYKRPKFEVDFEPVTSSYRLNDEVTVEGFAKAYAGSNIDGAQVKYRVVRTARFPWWDWWFWGWWNPWQEAQMEIANGELTTDETGKFSIKFKALPDLAIPRDRKPEFNYDVLADVTDITGETQVGSASVRVGYVALEAGLNVPEKMNLNLFDSLEVWSNNLNGQPESASMQLTVHALQAPAKIYLNRYWDKPDRQVMTKPEFEKQFPHFAFANEDDITSWPLGAKVFDSKVEVKGQQKVKVGANNWKQGAYVFVMTTADRFGTPVEVKKFATLFSPQATTPPVPSVLWAVQNQQKFEPGDSAITQIFSSLKQICAFGHLANRERNLRNGWLKVDGNRDIAHAITEEDRGNAGISIFAVHHNRYFSDRFLYQVPWSNKDLKIEYATFRNKLLPGQDEEWTIKISGPKMEKVAAEMVSAMYDASLDAFVPHQWSGFSFPVFQNFAYWSAHENFGMVTGMLLQRDWQESVYAWGREYTSLDWFDFPMYDYDNRVMMYRQGSISMDMVKSGAIPPPSAAREEAQMADGMADKPKNGGAPEPESPKPLPEKPADVDQPVKVRTNLNETVFFFPHLMTDSDGKVILKFKMNEALTRWKLFQFAHTQDSKFALSENSVVTQKDLMVLPNPPRFFRESDEIEFTAKVSNLSAKDLSGTARLNLSDALTNQPVDELLGNTQIEIPFSAKAGQSARLAWKLKIPVGKVHAVVYRVVARSGDFSDGEESALPVVTNRMLVTETMPLPVRGGQTKFFNFKSMQDNASTTLQNHRFTLEYTSNPAWYAVQALPYLMEYPYECNEQIFNRFYANILATHVANSNPKIKAVFDRWRQYEPAALMSNLSKNQELKSALLEETPWVLAAQSEEAQKQNIAVLFDLNRMSNELDGAVTKLAQRQEGNGGWSWFPGGQPSWYITQYIVEGMGHLQRLKVRPAEKQAPYRQMLEKAVKFCDFQLKEQYESLERAVKNGQVKWEDDHLDYIVVHYLYARSFFLPKGTDQAGDTPDWASDNRVAFDDQMTKILDYYFGQAEKFWTKRSEYQQGMLALGLSRFGKADTPARIVRSLKERALKNEELGMYWKYPVGWWWYQAPIETHALMIEVFEDVAKDAQSVDDLKVWLLKNKQTNHWKTTKATAAAVFSLLMSGDNWLMEDKPANISFPAASLSTVNSDIKAAQTNAESGTGYFKRAWEGEKVTKSMSVLKVENPNKVVSWGGVYWQYFEQLDKIKTFEDTPLKLKNQVFKVVKSDIGEKIQPLTVNSGGVLEGVKVGDKLMIRIELRVDREMEYVHMKDMRASGFEPVNVLSLYKWQGGLGYYESTRDLATNFFIEYLPKGTFVFEYPLRVVHNGDFANGITTIQCMYAPEFTSHSQGDRIQVK